MSKNIWIGLAISTIIAFILLSFRITQTPMGLTGDEAAFGWNATLLSRTGIDENGVKYPVFVNSMNKKDWRQPWTQYYLVIFFKIFGPSVYNLRISSVVLVLFSALLLFRLTYSLLGKTFAFASYILFITTPIIFMHSHLGLDNIMPLPFTLIWLISIYQYSQKPSAKYLLIAGLSLGVSFYSYKGMRATVPVWSFLSCCYVLYLHYQPKIKINKLVTRIIPFVIGVLPAILLIPYFDYAYPGSIFGGARPKFDNIYDLVYPYLSHYDLTFLFIKGDDLLFHSTKFHGMVLLASLPLFFIGVYQSVRQGGFWLFISSAYFTGPLLYGLVESVHRASRIISLIPAYILICTLGLRTIVTSIKLKTILLTLIALLFTLNFYDFARYYWYTYPKFTENIFGNLKVDETYREFAIQAKKLNLQPYIHHDIYDGFIEGIYFSTPLPQVFGDDLPPKGSIYLTFQSEVPTMIKIGITTPVHNILVRP